MNMLEIMRTRRSIRSYKKQPVSDEAVTKILQAGMLSASGKAIRPWEFIVVRDKETLQRLAECRQVKVKMLQEADVAIVVLGNKEMSDVWIEDCSAVISNMHLMAHALGLGSCWIQGRLRIAMNGQTTDAFIRELLGHPEHMEVLATLAIGIPNEEKAGYVLEDLPVEKIHIEKY